MIENVLSSILHLRLSLRCRFFAYYLDAIALLSPKSFLDELGNTAEYDMLFSIEPMPKYSVSFDTVMNDATVEAIEPSDESHYQILGLLDSGIADIPYLSPWMSDKRWSVYPDTSIDPTHGTFIAGVALYGDRCESKNWVDHRGIKLFDTAVFPGSNESIAEDELISNVREAIELNHEKVKIWNLSISVTRPVSDNKFSDLATGQLHLISYIENQRLVI